MLCQAKVELSGFYQNRNVWYSCSNLLSFFAPIAKPSPGMILRWNSRCLPCLYDRLFLRFLRLFRSYSNLPELHLLIVAPDGHRAICVFLHHQLLCLHGLFDLIEIPVMGNREVIAESPLCLDAEDPVLGTPYLIQFSPWPWFLRF